MSEYSAEIRPPQSELQKRRPADGPVLKKRSRRGVLWTVIFLIVLGLGVIAYRARMSGGAGAGRRRGGFGMAMPPPPVVVKAAERGNINVIVNGLGTVTPLATVTVRTQINGQLVQVNFTEGQMVNKGDVLALIDQRPYDAALKQAQGQLQQAQAQLKEAQADADRYVTLSGQDSISKQQVDAQKALVSQYGGMVTTDQGVVENAQLNLDYCKILAPVAGRVGLRLVDQGNYVTPGDATGLVILTQVKPITVIFPVPEDYIPALQARLKAPAQGPDAPKVKIDAYDRTHTSKLASGFLATVDNLVDTTTGTLKLRAIFPNDDLSLFPNQFVNIGMLLNVDRGVTVIPTSAIERGRDGSFVYIVDDKNIVTAKNITLGDTEGERVAVTAGVSPGDKVVIDGADRLKDGMEVVVQLQAANGSAAAPAAKAQGEHKHWKPAGGP